MKIAIPSYNRASVLKNKTLAYLLSEGYDPSDIVVFLKNEEQLQLYKQEIQTPLTWVVCNNQTIADKRTFISKYFPVNEEILCVDDDVRKIKMLSAKPLKDVVSRLFQLTRQEGLTTWGIYPVNNLYFCKERVVKGSVYIIGCFYGYIKKEPIEWPSTFSKEDYWLSCFKIQRDGAVLRYEGICPDTSYYANGGLSSIRTLEIEEEHAKFVANQYPELVRYKLKKSHPDLVFIRKPKTLLNF